MSVAGDFTVVVDGFGLPEAPREEPGGSVAFSDITRGGVYRWDQAAGVACVVPHRRGVGGLLVHADGGLVVAGRDVRVIDGGRQRLLLELPDAAGFNDLATDASGRIHAGVLRFAPMRGQEPRPGEVWRIEPDGSAAPVAEGVTWPNGIGFSPAGDAMYVADYQDACVLAYRAGARQPELLARAPRGTCDGLAVDAEGGVWVALGPAGAIARWRPDGTLDEVVDLPASFVASLSFAGPGRDRLLVAGIAAGGDGTIWRGRSAIPGLPVAPATA